MGSDNHCSSRLLAIERIRLRVAVSLVGGQSASTISSANNGFIRSPPDKLEHPQGDYPRAIAAAK